MQNEIPVTMMWSKLKPEFGIRIPVWLTFQLSLSKAEVVISQQWIEVCQKNLVCRQILTFQKDDVS